MDRDAEGGGDCGWESVVGCLVVVMMSDTFSLFLSPLSFFPVSFFVSGFPARSLHLSFVLPACCFSWFHLPFPSSVCHFRSFLNL